MRAGLFVLLAGCGFRIAPGSDGGTIDADGIVDGDGSDGSIDAPIDGPFQSTCLLAWLNDTISFQSPAELAAVNTTSFDRDPFVSADELTIWYSSGNSNSQGGSDVFEARRANR